MYSLVTLDVSCNLIADIDEVNYVAGLPCLEELILTANPVASIVGEYGSLQTNRVNVVVTVIPFADYRQRVFARFGDRCTELFLDNEKAEGTEIDMALVLAALRQSGEKPPLLQTSFTETGR